MISSCIKVCKNSLYFLPDQMYNMGDEVAYLKLPDQIYYPGNEPDENKIAQQHSNLQLVDIVRNRLGKELFSRIEKSFLNPIITLADRDIKFSGKMFHYFMQRRILTKGEDLWFRIHYQPTRFSKREFFLTTCILYILYITF